MENKNNDKLAYHIRGLATKIQELEQAIEDIRNAPKVHPSLEDAIDAIPGRRVLFTLVDSQLFTTTQDGNRGNAMTFEISQDGPWVMTHYPFVVWRSTLPTTATDFGRWRPVSTWDIPDQVVDTNIIDISYELQDSGSGRNLQNEQAVPPVLSQPGSLEWLPKPCLFRPQSVISFIPTYEDITFGGGTVTTEGRLVVALLGYKIVNL
jgi:hypothetical protein